MSVVNIEEKKEKIHIILLKFFFDNLNFLTMLIFQEIILFYQLQ